MPRKLSPLLCWPTKHFTSAPRTCPPQPAPAARQSWVKSPMLRPANRTTSKLRLFIASLLPYFIASFCLASCSHSSHSDPSSLTFVIESSPTNLDPRFATDSQSQRIDGLLFSGLLERDNQMNFHGDLAVSWSTPDPLTYGFHLRRGVRFHDGRALTSADVKATFDFIRNPANKSPKQGALRMVASIETPDDATVILHLRQAYASFSVNLIPSAIGIIPVLARQLDLAVTDRPGTNFNYLGFNLEDPILAHREIRQALALATDREALVRYL